MWGSLMEFLGGDDFTVACCLCADYMFVCCFFFFFISLYLSFHDKQQLNQQNHVTYNIFSNLEYLGALAW